MDNCIFCDSPVNNFEAECSTCGFNASSESFNADIVQLYYKDSMRNDWRKGITFIFKLNDYLIKKKGSASTNPERGGWSKAKTAELLGKSKSGISELINLAKEMLNYPELEKSKTSNIAIKRLKEIKTGGLTSNIHSEIDLQNRIVKEWNNLFNEWELLSNDGKFDTREGIGILDFLARHISEGNRYLVIELKREQSSDETVGQILRYMGWVKTKLAGENGKVEGIIISRSEDENVKYALDIQQIFH
ncbi:MAG: DUF1016 family protein [Deltaproteobacteria bacterium]|nr:DUF1016 family protein [Deltaproteobacteria bacterium]